MKKNILLFIVIAILFSAMGFYSSVKQEELYTSENPVAAHLWTLSLPDTHGQMQALSQWKDKTLIVNFWATWCAPCVQEMPELSALQTELAAKHIQIIGIGIDSAANIVEFNTKYKIDYPLYTVGMQGTELARHFGNQSGGLPFTLLIGPSGQVKKTYLGRLKLEQLRADIALL